MNWEKMTAPDFAAAVSVSKGVCLLPFGIVEKHGDHLPLGQDLLYIHAVCTLAAEMEPAVVFPYYYFGQIAEARHVPGAIAIRPDLQLSLLENICDEISRNGFSKILIVNGHGGNSHFLEYYCQIFLDKPKPYMIFLSDHPGLKEWAEKKEAKVDGHGGEAETCAMLHLHPELVKLDAFADYGLPMRRLEKYANLRLYTGIWWYADFPGHFAGERVSLTEEKGKAFTEEHVKNLVEQVRLLKSDDTPMELYKEFLGRVQKPENRYP
ncbi:MAG: creatininase family protein [Bacillota bacterium]